jgi:hypothetical protein
MDAACEGRLVEMVKVLCKYPWIVEVIKQRLNNPHPYMGVYVADWSEMCISLGRKAYCAQNGAVRETKLELVFSRLEPYRDERGVQTKGLAGIHHGGERIREDTPAPKTASMRQIQSTATTGTLGGSSSSTPPRSRVSPLRPLSKPP